MVKDKDIIIIHGEKPKRRNELHFNHKRSFRASISKDKKKEIHRDLKYGDKATSNRGGDYIDS